MDLTEIGICRWFCIKGCRVRRFVENSAHPPSCESPLKIPIRFVQLLAIRILIPIEDMNIHRGVVIGKTWCIRTVLLAKKILICTVEKSDPKTCFLWDAHWSVNRFSNLFIAPLPIAVWSKKRSLYKHFLLGTILTHYWIAIFTHRKLLSHMHCNTPCHHPLLPHSYLYQPSCTQRASSHNSSWQGF